MRKGCFLLALIWMLILSSMPIVNAESTWWNLDWKYRRRIDIIENSGYSLTNFPVEVTFKHGGKVQPDGGDIRVVVEGIEIPNHVSSLNSTHANIIFEVNVTASAIRSVYVYYGNPHAIAPNYPKVSLKIVEGQTGHAIIDDAVYIGWDHTSWGYVYGLGNIVTVWNDFRIDFNRNSDPSDDKDLITDWSSWKGGIGRHFRGDTLQAIGLGLYQGFVRTPIYIDINFLNARLRVYKDNTWVETIQADFLYMVGSSWDYANYGTGSEQNIVDGIHLPPSLPDGEWNHVLNSPTDPRWMALRDSSSGIVFSSMGIGIGVGYNYSLTAKEATAWDRRINFFGFETTNPMDPYDQPSDCRIYWYADNTNDYSNIEVMVKIFHNQPSTIILNEEESIPSPYVEIDLSYVSDDRADVGCTQSIGFHVAWDNGSNVVGGTVNLGRLVEKSKTIIQRISTGLVGYWSFEEESGNSVHDSSGYGNDGTIVGSVSRVNGKYGKALWLSNGYVVVPHSISLDFKGKHPFTLEAWIKADSLQGHSSLAVNIIDKFSNYGLVFDHSNSDARGVVFRSDGTWYHSGEVKISSGVWHHYVGVYDPPYLRVYLDGNEVVSREVGSRILDANLNNVVFGTNMELTSRFNGIIDEVRIYDMTLGQEQIRSRMQSMLMIRNLSQGQRVELCDTVGALKASDEVGPGENKALLNVSFLYFPFSGFYKIYANDGITLLCTTPIFADILRGDEFSVSAKMETEMVDIKEYVTNGTGWVTFGVTSQAIGKEFWKVIGVNASGVKFYSQLAQDQTIIWDRVNVVLNISNSRVNIGSLVNITTIGVYEYDGSTFLGVISFNDSLTKPAVGRYGYTVGSVIDALYGLTVYRANEVYCIFDRIMAETKVETLTLGSVQVTLSLSFEYDGFPVEDAVVKVNDIMARNLGNGLYSVSLSSWMPFLTISIKAERVGFDPLVIDTTSYALGNIILYSSSIAVFSMVALRLNTRRIRRKRWLMNAKQLEELVRKSGRIRLKEASEAIGIDAKNIKTLLFELIKEGRIKGSFTSDGEGFVTDEKLEEEIRGGLR